MKLKDCIITHKDSTVLRTFSNTTRLGVNGHYGVDLICDDVFSACFGVVAEVYRDDGHYHVAVQYNDRIMLRYCNLKYSHVVVGQPVIYRQLIGVADKHVHFEYCIPTMQDSDRCVRICDITYIKTDPMVILVSRDEMVPDFRDNMCVQNYDGDNAAMLNEITAAVIDEFTGGRGNE